MRIGTDDEAYRISADFLGPKGWRLPWTARYTAYGIGIALFLVLLLAERRLGVPGGWQSLAFTLLITVGITRWVGRRISFETTLRAVLLIGWHELTAERPDRRTTRAVFIRRG
jgi:hypothetical protein